jgi:hypothetical protein
MAEKGMSGDGHEVREKVPAAHALPNTKVVEEESCFPHAHTHTHKHTNKKKVLTHKKKTGGGGGVLSYFRSGQY